MDMTLTNYVSATSPSAGRVAFGTIYRFVDDKGQPIPYTTAQSLDFKTNRMGPAYVLHQLKDLPPDELAGFTANVVAQTGTGQGVLIDEKDAVRLTSWMADAAEEPGLAETVVSTKGFITALQQLGTRVSVAERAKIVDRLIARDGAKVVDLVV